MGDLMSTHYIPIRWTVKSIGTRAIYTGWSEGDGSYVLGLRPGDPLTKRKCIIKYGHPIEIETIYFSEPFTYEHITDYFNEFFNVRGVKPLKQHCLHVVVHEEAWQVGIALSYRMILSNQFITEAIERFKRFPLPKVFQVSEAEPILSRYERPWVI